MVKIDMGNKKNIKGKYTLELSKYIPVELLKKYLSTYNIIKTFKKDDLPDFPTEHINKIFYHLSKLEKKKFLNKNIVDDIKYNINFNIISNPNYNKAKFKKHLNERGYPRDDALDILLFLLISDLKNQSKKPKYDLIYNFLTEQDIYINLRNKSGGGLDDEVLRKRFKRMNDTEIIMKFREYQIISPIKIEDFTILEKISKKFTIKDAINYGKRLKVKNKIDKKDYEACVKSLTYSFNISCGNLLINLMNSAKSKNYKKTYPKATTKEIQKLEQDQEKEINLIKNEILNFKF